MAKKMKVTIFGELCGWRTMTDPLHPETVANVMVPEVEVTPAMTAAGVSVLEADPYIDLGSGYTEAIAHRVIRAALSARRLEKTAVVS